MGAYIVLFPRARVITWVPPFFILPLPSVVVLAIWFVEQFLSGISTLGGHGAGGVAWWAHIGGFIIGALLAWGSRRRR